MPPKRAASTAATAAGRAKKAKTGAAATKAAPKAAAAPKNPPKSKRWSAVSGSGNADAEFKKIAAKNPDEFFSFICTCPPSLVNGDDDDSDEWEDEDKDHEDGEDDDKEERSGGGCGRPNCKCHKPMNEYPDHPWIITKAGYRKLYTMQILVTLRNPDNFNMYTYNDHAGYGVLEVVENLLLDYVEAEGSWKDQWVVCEATSRFLLHGMSTPMLGVDDSERVTAAVCLVGVMFLSMLARLEREKLLAEGSEVKDLGVVMALYMKVAASMRESSILDEEDDDESSSSKAKKTFPYNAGRFDDYILAYADKFGIPLKGPNDIEELLSQRDSGVALPGGTDGNNDPWGWKAALKNYEKDHGTGRAGTSKIGGDQLDITTWTKSERQDASFDGKDPLGKRDLDALKKGMVMQLG